MRASPYLAGRVVLPPRWLRGRPAPEPDASGDVSRIPSVPGAAAWLLGRRRRPHQTNERSGSMDDEKAFGVWRVEWTWTPDLAAELEDLGYGILWIGGSKDSDLRVAEELLAATKTVRIATGIVNVWTTDADVVARSFHRLDERFPGRFVLGFGAGHRESAEGYNKPYTAVNEYLDRLDANDVPAERRV